jgi:hypothetical protein
VREGERWVLDLLLGRPTVIGFRKETRDECARIEGVVGAERPSM